MGIGKYLEIMIDGAGKVAERVGGRFSYLLSKLPKSWVEQSDAYIELDEERGVKYDNMERLSELETENRRLVKKYDIGRMLLEKESRRVRSKSRKVDTLVEKVRELGGRYDSLKAKIEDEIEYQVEREKERLREQFRSEIEDADAEYTSESRTYLGIISKLGSELKVVKRQLELSKGIMGFKENEIAKLKREGRLMEGDLPGFLRAFEGNKEFDNSCAVCLDANLKPCYATIGFYDTFEIDRCDLESGIGGLFSSLDKDARINVLEYVRSHPDKPSHLEVKIGKDNVEDSRVGKTTDFQKEEILKLEYQSKHFDSSNGEPAGTLVYFYPDQSTLSRMFNKNNRKRNSMLFERVFSTYTGTFSEEEQEISEERKSKK